MDLSGKVAVVTGGAAGIGRHVSLGFARAGADVAIAALEEDATRSVCGEIEAMGRSAVGWPLDLNAFAQLEGIRDAVLERFGRVDILATVAGIPGNWSLMHETPEADWDEVMNINLKGMYLTCKAFIPSMIARGSGGAIITFTSSLGQRVHPKRGIYAVSKWGIIALTKTMAIELAAEPDPGQRGGARRRRRRGAQGPVVRAGGGSARGNGGGAAGRDGGRDPDARAHRAGRHRAPLRLSRERRFAANHR